jgi:hypothetical protein
MLYQSPTLRLCDLEPLCNRYRRRLSSLSFLFTARAQRRTGVGGRPRPPAPPPPRRRHPGLRRRRRDGETSCVPPRAQWAGKTTPPASPAGVPARWPKGAPAARAGPFQFCGSLRARFPRPQPHSPARPPRPPARPARTRPRGGPPGVRIEARRPPTPPRPPARPRRARPPGAGPPAPPAPPPRRQVSSRSRVARRREMQPGPRALAAPASSARRLLRRGEDFMRKRPLLAKVAPCAWGYAFGGARRGGGRRLAGGRPVHRRSACIALTRGGGQGRVPQSCRSCPALAPPSRIPSLRTTPPCEPPPPDPPILKPSPTPRTPAPPAPQTC